MTRNLPINLDVPLTTDCWSFYRLSIIQTEEQYVPWFIENFIDLFMSFRFEIFYHNWDVNRIIIYDEILYTETVSAFQSVNLIHAIIDAINNNKYVLLIVDNYFIKGTLHYQQEHRIHDILVTGYDNNKSEISFLGMNINDTFWGIHTINYSELEEAFHSAYSQFNKKTMIENIDDRVGGHPFSFINKKPIFRKVNITRVYYQMIKYIYGGIIKTFAEINNEYKSFNEYRGSSVYLGIKELIDQFAIFSQLQNDQIFFGFKRLIEHKLGLHYRVTYLMEHDYIEYNHEILKKLQLTHENAKNLFTLSTKFIHSEKRKNGTKIVTLINNLKEQELDVLNQILKLIEK